MAARTLYEKIWDDHVIERLADGTCLIAVDRHIIHDGTSRQAFDRLRETGRTVRRPETALAVPDHLVPTRDRGRAGGWPNALVVEELVNNCREAGIEVYEMDDPRHGIVHVVGPEQGFTQPGLIMACADSHTSSHGALGALAFGIGTSDLEHILATQALMLKPAQTMRITLNGSIGDQITGKDLALAVIGEIGAAGGVGYAVEFAGQAIDELPMEGRLTLCNMAVEAGARSAIIAPDQITVDWLEGRPMSPKGQLWDRAVAYWRTLCSDVGAVFDREVTIDVANLSPLVTWGTSPEHVLTIGGRIPDPATAPNESKADNWRRALNYMGLEAGTAMTDIAIDRVFIGSCTNSRMEDLRAAARVVKGRHIAPGVVGMVVPGSNLIKQEAEAEGLDRIFVDAGFEWRDAGCSMCFGSAHDSVAPEERCASTSNRNFENRQGARARTHLVSPAMAAAAGIAGHFVDVRDMIGA